MTKHQKRVYTGTVFFPDLEEMQNLQGVDIWNSATKDFPLTLIELPVPVPPRTNADPYRRLKADMPTSDAGYGGTFNLWLYKDRAVKGTWTFLAEANQPKQTVDGTFSEKKGELIIHALLYEEGKPKWGLHIEAERDE